MHALWYILIFIGVTVALLVFVNLKEILSALGKVFERGLLISFIATLVSAVILAIIAIVTDNIGVMAWILVPLGVTIALGILLLVE